MDEDVPVGERLALLQPVALRPDLGVVDRPAMDHLAVGAHQPGLDLVVEEAGEKGQPGLHARRIVDRHPGALVAGLGKVTGRLDLEVVPPVLAQIAPGRERGLDDAVGERPLLDGDHAEAETCDQQRETEQQLG